MQQHHDKAQHVDDEVTNSGVKQLALKRELTWGSPRRRKIAAGAVSSSSSLWTKASADSTLNNKPFSVVKYWESALTLRFNVVSGGKCLFDGKMCSYEVTSRVKCSLDIDFRVE